MESYILHFEQLQDLWLSLSPLLFPGIDLIENNPVKHSIND